MVSGEIRFVPKAFFKERGAEVFRNSARLPSCENPLKSLHHLVQLSAVRKRTANDAHASLDFYSLHTAVGNGAMNKFGSCCQLPNEHFKPRMLLFTVGNGAISAPGY